MTSNILFKLKNMELDKVQQFDIESNASVAINGVMFQTRTVSRIEFVKYNFDGEGERLFIEAYMGNIQLNTVVTEDDYVLRTDKECTPHYWIDKAESYDYK